MPEYSLTVAEDAPTLIRTTARRVAGLIGEAVAARGVCHLALSGGRTPADLHRLLARPEVGGRIPWTRVHIWFGDERCVPPEHPDSNFRMARETLLDPLGLPAQHIHRMRGEAEDPRKAAAEYAAELSAAAPGDGHWPILDIVLLGVGPDGHVASLFPGSANLAEGAAPVSAARVSEQHGWRISLTLPVIEHARHVLVLASGSSKAGILSRVLGPTPTAADRALPAALVSRLPQAEWHLDADAAGGL
ncbi:MAG: 6-phosphogluconolactonase [Chromatiales bacterium]|jgi:6-phosphogluconolactonase